MGTFHQNKHELHGITVVVDTDGPEVFVGRCDDLDGERIYLLDADVHRDGDDGRSKEEYLRRAAQFGVWPKHPRLTLDRSKVTSVRRLGDL
jgi:hypothetical protein